jgi:hypothetical protein
MSSRSISEGFPGFDRVYHVGNPLASRPYRGHMKLKDPEEFTLPRGESKPRKPVRITHDMGEPTPGDVIWTDMVVPLVVSQRFVDVLLEHGFTGWGTYPVEVHAKGGRLVPGYHGLSIKGRCGPIQYEKSQVIYEEFPGGRFPSYRGMYFDPNSWDGSDFFMPTTPDTGWTFILEPVKKALAKARIGNLLLERADQIVHPMDVDPKYMETRPDG